MLGLANLSCNVSNHELIVQQFILQPIITLSYSTDSDIHQQAATAIRELAVSYINKMEIVQEGGL